MRKRILLVLTVSVILLSACDEMKGYKKTPTGLFYKFELQNNDAQEVHEGDMIVGEITISLDTSVLYTNTGNAERLFSVEPQITGALYEGLLMMHIGDKAIFAIEADSVSKILPFIQENQMPSMYEKGKGMKLYYEFKIQGVVTKAELEAERLERERIERERIERESQLNGKWIRTYFNEALWRQEQEIVTFSGKLLRLQFSSSGNESIYEYERVANKIYVNGTLFFTIEPNGNLNCKGDIYERIR